MSEPEENERDEREDEAHLNIRQAAGMLDVSEKTVRRYVKKGSLPARKISNVFQFLRKDVEALSSKGGRNPELPRRGPGEEDAEPLSDMERRIERLERAIRTREKAPWTTAASGSAACGGEAASSSAPGAVENMGGAEDENALTAERLHERIRELQNAIASNERGLALLREENEKKDETIESLKQERSLTRALLEGLQEENRTLKEALRSRQGWSPFRK